ncbi:PREDICTED: uncharacterized protein LOC106748725 [Dinoponera quadriceps]|uniref:Gustatory receptor n=1 Tax=Dinoponera quadriceps TaxID=609295 RepID=A0A6P3XWV5_DINQU|nr:PREDICTED: uncharacterized protein LOC106748725 [Dinoponera quadriceps]
MKIFAPPKHLSGAVAPLMTLNYLMGLRIVMYPRGKLRTMSSLIYLLLLLGIFCTSLPAQYSFTEKVKLLKLEFVLHRFILYLGAFVVMCKMVLGYFYTKAVNACYRKIAQIDETLERLGSIINYGEVYLLSIGAVITWFLCIQTRFKLVNELLSEGATMSTTERMKLGFCDLFAAEDYTKITNSKQCQNIISIKLFNLNRQLQSRIRTSKSGERNCVKSQTWPRLLSQIQKHFDMKLQGVSRNQFRDLIVVQRLIIIEKCRKRTYLLQTIRQVHLELCRILKTLCISFGIQITLDIGISIIFITGLLYILYIQQRQRTTGHILLDQAFTIITLIIVHVLKIVLINFVCKHATNEGKKTTEVIHEIYGCCPDTDIREEIQQFDLQISQSPVEFFIFGIFLNFQFLGSCLKTVTTYLVIMIQMSNSLESS